MKRVLVATITALILAGIHAPASTATPSPVPGRFCKTVDIGKKVKTIKYGIVVCKKDGTRARWR
jgi:hypothetical protein